MAVVVVVAVALPWLWLGSYVLRADGHGPEEQGLGDRQITAVATTLDA